MRWLALALMLASAQALACPNASTTVTIPPSGAALVVPYDQACNVLPGSGFALQQQTPSLANWNAITSPGYTGDASGIHLSANGAAAGTSGTFKATYVNGLNFTMSFVVGTPVTSVSSGTTTP